MKKLTLLLCLFLVFSSALFSGNAIRSYETPYTIMKVQVAQTCGENYLIGSGYWGHLIALDYDGKTLWENKLSGYMNHALWSADITGDGNDEVFAANADGSLYCVSSKGELLWKFRKNEAPMYAVTVVHKDHVPYVVCGGFDNSIYYLNAKGEEIKEIKSSSYSVEKSFGDPKEATVPPNNVHMSNFLRVIKQADGTEKLAVLGTNNSMQNTGSIYLFNVLDEKPLSHKKIKSKKAQGAMNCYDTNGDGNEEILLGPSPHINESGYTTFDPATFKQKYVQFKTRRHDMGGFAYLVCQPIYTTLEGEDQYLILAATSIVLQKPEQDIKQAEIITNAYSYNDMCHDKEANLMILASAQSGGNSIHIIDLKAKNWKTAYENLSPQGNLQEMLDNHAIAQKQMANFKRPPYERKPLPVYLLSDSKVTDAEKVANDIKQNYSSPIFLNYHFSGFAQDPKDWGRDGIANEKYQDKRDKRRKYTLTQEEIIAKVKKDIKTDDGLAMWGGHGNDPMMYSLETLKSIIDANNGNKTVLIFPELEKHDADFAWVLEHHIYPLAEYAQKHNANIYIRTKHTFWQSAAYMSQWKRMQSGEFADVFVPAMEQTSDKSMDLTVPARMGYWMSGAVNAWGDRGACDNVSFDRMRQFSDQNVPNHFLRQMIYSVSNGAQYLNNFNVDQSHMSLLWELIAKGVIYVPERDELLSISPVHLGMLPPDNYTLNEGSNVKWLNFYDEEKEKANPLVFSHLNGTWPGAPVTEWDFSSYATGAKDRRLNFLPNNPNGLVMMTPPQEGKFADKEAPRGKMEDKLNPIYKGIMKEYITDSRNYYSADGTQTYKANEYYTTIQKEIEESAQKLPINVKGEVAWVAAQSAPKHIRLTLIDGGYINPSDKVAHVTFNNIKIKSITDLLSGEKLKVNEVMNVKVPCGLFRFLDVELNNSLTVE